MYQKKDSNFMCDVSFYIHSLHPETTLTYSCLSGESRWKLPGEILQSSFVAKSSKGEVEESTCKCRRPKD